MKTINMTPDTLHRVLKLVSDAALPGLVARNLLDFVHETIRNAECLNDAALDLMDAADILHACHTLAKKLNNYPVGLFREATELQHGEGADTDQQLHLLYISALLNSTGATGTTEPLSDAADLLFEIAHALYTPEDEDEQ